MTKNTAHLSPLDQAMMNRPRGAPRTGLPPKKRVPEYPLDFYPKAAKHERAQKALASVQKTWTTFKQLDDNGMDRMALAKSAFPAIERSMKELDGARDALKAERESVERAIVREIDKGANPALAAEVRRHVASLGEMKALTFIRQRIEAGDTTTVSAVLGAPAFLSGVTDTNIATLRANAEMKFAPDRVEQRKNITRDLKRIDDVHVRLLNQIHIPACDWERGEYAEKLKGFAADE